MKRNHRGRPGHEYQGTSLRLLVLCFCKVFLKAANTCITPFQTEIEIHLHKSRSKVHCRSLLKLSVNWIKLKSETSGYHWFENVFMLVPDKGLNLKENVKEHSLMLLF